MMILHKRNEKRHRSEYTIKRCLWDLVEDGVGIHVDAR